MTRWRSTLYVAWVAQVISTMAFTFVFPFVPLYVRELGVEDEGSAVIWAGLVVAAAPVTMAIFSPIWGMVADRYGRKIMVERAMFGGAVLLVLMGMVENVHQLLALRFVQGAITGTVTALVVLVSSSTPLDRSGYSQGLMRMAFFGGASLGPILGGPVADHFGYRFCFFVAGVLLLASGMVVAFGAKEEFTPPARESHEANNGLREVLLARGFLATIAILFFLHLALAFVAPIFPLFVEQLAVSKLRVASKVGLIIGAGGIASAIASAVVGKIGDRASHKKVLVGCIVVSGIVFVPHALAQGVGQLFVVRVLFALSCAGVFPMANAVISGVVPRHSHGKAFGLTATLGCLARALGPSLGGLAAYGLGLRVPFVMMGILLLAVGLSYGLRANDPVGRHRCDHS